MKHISRKELISKSFLISFKSSPYLFLQWKAHDIQLG